MVAESWFPPMCKARKKQENGPHLMIDILAFEVASLMSRLVLLWKLLSDKKIVKLRDDVTNSVAIKKLISEDDDYIVRSISSEIIENLIDVAKAVAGLSRKCNDPYMKRFDHVFKDMIKLGEDPYGWNYTWKKMDRKTKKMERFILMISNLYRSLEYLSELKNTLERMEANKDTKNGTMVELEKNMAWKQQEVNQLKDFSLWNRSYNYVVRLLARSVFTVYKRIEHVFDIGSVVDFEIKDSKVMDSRFSAVFLNMSTKSCPIASPNASISFHFHPLRKSKIASSQLYGENISKDLGHLELSTTKTTTKSMRNCYLAIIEPKQKWINAPRQTLGAAALALHYANLIIAIEKLVETPHLIDVEVRDDLYNMLPNSVRLALKAKLRPLKSLNYDSVLALAEDWNEAISVKLEWLAPLAHNTIRWHTARSFGDHSMYLRERVLLVQTLYFANQEKTEAVITEILVGLNFVWRYNREMIASA